MIVKFKNGTQLNCAAPLEQKLFKDKDGTGWLLVLSIAGTLTSAELDKLLSLENISELTFVSDPTEDEKSKRVFTLKDYDKVTSVMIRYSEEGTTKAEIQLTKGV